MFLIIGYSKPGEGDAETENKKTESNGNGRKQRHYNKDQDGTSMYGRWWGLVAIYHDLIKLLLSLCKIYVKFTMPYIILLTYRYFKRSYPDLF